MKKIILLALLPLFAFASCGPKDNEKDATIIGKWSGVELSVKITANSITEQDIAKIRTKWLEQFNNNPQLLPSYFFIFNEDGTGSMKCLNGSGSLTYTLDGKDLTLNLGNKTLDYTMASVSSAMMGLEFSYKNEMDAFVKEKFPNLDGRVKTTQVFITFKKI